MIGNGIYTFGEAASLTGLSRVRVREWFLGRPSESCRQPIFQSDYDAVDGDHAISFLDLLDVFVAGQLRKHGVALQTLRCVYAQLRTDLETSHPFCRQELLSDGKHVFLRGLDERGREEIAEVLTRQKVFPTILLPFLKKIDYGKISKLAERWRIADRVVLDPALCFGKPIVEAAGLPTAILAAAYYANGKDEERVAGWYNIHSSHVLAAVSFESKLAA